MLIKGAWKRTPPHHQGAPRSPLSGSQELGMRGCNTPSSVTNRKGLLQERGLRFGEQSRTDGLPIRGDKPRGTSSKQVRARE